MSTEESKQFSLNQWLGHGITIAVLIATLAASQGSMMAQTGALKSELVEVKTNAKNDVAEMKRNYQDVVQENTRVMQSLASRVSRLEGKLEK